MKCLNALKYVHTKDRNSYKTTVDIFEVDTKKPQIKLAMPKIIMHLPEIETGGTCF